MRLDVYLATYYPESSRSLWQKHIAAGYVRVNGDLIKEVDYLLGEDDEVSFELPKPADYSARSVPVLYEDENVIVMNKPAGVLTHSKGALNEEFTVAEFVRGRTTYKQGTNRPGIVHRLDRDTSGVMLAVKNDATATLMQRQFAQRKAKKTYIAIVDGALKEPKATIDLPIMRNPKALSTFRVGAGGKSAQTSYEVLARTDKYSLLKLQPSTGRTHQLRVHLAYLGVPIHGDRVYGLESERLYLHAYKLEVTLPGGERTIFEAPVPQDFAKYFPGVDYANI